METNRTEAVWLDENASCSLLMLAEASGLSSTELEWLVEAGVLAPLDTPQATACFPASTLPVARMARRLRDDFELDRLGLAVALRLLERIDALERELAMLRARLPGHSDK